jgi:serine protease inhibitor
VADTFSADISKWVELKAKGNTDKVVRATFIQLATNVILRSPVDTGRFRNNWFTSIGRQATGTSTFTQKSGQQAINQAAELSKQAPGRVIWLTNNLPYARALEFGLYGNGPKTTGGYSLQAPSGMVRVTVSEFNEIVRREANKVNK